MITPYIQIQGPDVGYTDSGMPQEALGYHAFFVTFVPFIPSFLSDDFTRIISGEVSRIKLIVSRQIRFLNDLSSCKTGAAETFDLRLASIPQAGQPYNRLRIFFIGKVFHEDKSEAVSRAVELWKKFCGYFPSEDPFNYPLQTVASVQDRTGRTVPSAADLLQLALRPLAMNAQVQRNFTEIRKYEDRDPMLSDASVEQSEHFIGYFPHSFRPTIDFSAMSRFLETFAKQPQKCVASICLRPTTLTLVERQNIDRMMDHYGRLLRSANEAENWLAFYRKERFDDLIHTFEPLINQRNHLFMVKIQILGEEFVPLDVIGALGSEIMNNSTPEPRLWSEVQPAIDEEAVIARKNFELMEYRPWRRADVSSPLWRLSSLVTSYEAVGAFRLPVPPESGHMPGIRVRDEPFVVPAELATPQASKLHADVHVSIGKIIHRGTVTETDFFVSLSQLKRHGLVAGSTGSGKTNTCLHILTELWRKAQIPFLVVYPIDKPDYRLLTADPSVRDQLLIFTLGDDTTSPLRFNPFEVPPGILIRTHLSLLMRAFSAAFSMWDPLPAVYRAALRRAYEEAGFHDLRTAKGGDPGTTAPLLSRFYELLIETAEQMTQDYGREAKGNIRQGSEIRIRDLLNNAGHVLNVREGVPWEVMLKHPTVMEIGRVGSVEDSALVMGFLLMSLTSHLASRRKRQGAAGQQHVTLIEEAHRLMSAKGSSGGDNSADPRAKASEDFANILAEVRGFDESILIAEQIPTELVSGAIGNTYVKIMHWLEEQRNFELFADVMSLNKQQREYARTLPTGQAIVRGVNGRPLLIRVENYLDRFQNPDDTPVIDDSDEAVRTFMRGQLTRHQLRIPESVALTLTAPSAPATPRAETYEPRATNHLLKDADWTLSLPMQTCAKCYMLHHTRTCKYGTHVRGEWVMADPIFAANCDSEFEALVTEPAAAAVQVILDRLLNLFDSHFNLHIDWLTPDHRLGVIYCYLAHKVNKLRQELLGNQTPAAKLQRERSRWVVDRMSIMLDTHKQSIQGEG